MSGEVPAQTQDYLNQELTVRASVSVLNSDGGIQRVYVLKPSVREALILRAALDYALAGDIDISREDLQSQRLVTFVAPIYDVAADGRVYFRCAEMAVTPRHTLEVISQLSRALANIRPAIDWSEPIEIKGLTPHQQPRPQQPVTNILNVENAGDTGNAGDPGDVGT